METLLAKRFAKLMYFSNIAKQITFILNILTQLRLLQIKMILTPCNFVDLVHTS